MEDEDLVAKRHAQAYENYLANQLRMAKHQESYNQLLQDHSKQEEAADTGGGGEAGENGEEKGGPAGEPKNKRGGNGNMADDSQWRDRLDQAKKRSKAKANLEKNFIGKQIAKKAANKVAEGSTKIFKVLLIIALMVDLLEYLDLGLFSALVNVGIYAIVVTAGFFTWFLKNNNNKFSVFNLLKGQLWKFLILPLFEMLPIVNLLPFWTSTVVMMWVKVSYDRKKLAVVNVDKKKIKFAQDEYQEAI
ncbi:MAG: hypothetical protein V1688_00040 [bacterium]